MPRAQRLTNKLSPEHEEEKVRRLVAEQLAHALRYNDLVQEQVAGEMQGRGMKKSSKMYPAEIEENIHTGSSLVGSGRGYGVGMGMKTKGTKEEVYNGDAKHTAGGLTKKDLMMNNKGKVISKRQHEAGKIAIDRMKKHM